MKKKRQDWLKRLTDACTPITDDQFKKVLDYCKWVKIKATSDGFDEIFTKYKNG